MSVDKIVKNIESIVKVRDELYDLQRKADYLRRELDGIASEIVGFLKENGHLETKDDRRPGFTLVELLAVIAIIGGLLSLILPAVQSARESSRRSLCVNNLKQIAIGFQNHESARQIFPDGGEICWRTLTVVNGLPAAAPNQDLGWSLQILPFIEENNSWSIPDFNEMAKQLISIYACPTRRNPVVLMPAGRGSMDYAGNGGTDDGTTVFDQRPVTPCPRAYPFCQFRAMPGNGRDAPVTRRPDRSNLRGVSVKTSMITDGLSQTLLVGEKCMNRGLLHRDQTDDDAGWVEGWDWETIRWSFLQPQPDFYDPRDSMAHSGYDVERNSFGSSHPGSFNGAFCDGSVQQINYSIDLRTFQQMGSRNDGTR